MTETQTHEDKITVKDNFNMKNIAVLCESNGKTFYAVKIVNSYICPFVQEWTNERDFACGLDYGIAGKIATEHNRNNTLSIKVDGSIIVLDNPHFRTGVKRSWEVGD